MPVASARSLTAKRFEPLASELPVDLDQAIARLKVKAELPNHQGEGTRFEYESAYVEDIVEK